MDIIITIIILILIIGSIIGLIKAAIDNKKEFDILHSQKKVDIETFRYYHNRIAKHYQAYHTGEKDGHGAYVLTNKENRKTFIGVSSEVLRAANNSLIDKTTPFYEDLQYQPFMIHILMLDDVDIPTLEFLEKKLIKITNASCGYNRNHK